MATITPEELLLVFEGVKRVPPKRVLVDTCALMTYCPNITLVLQGQEPDLAEYERLEAAIRRSRKIGASQDVVSEMNSWAAKLGHLKEENPSRADYIERMRDRTMGIRDALQMKVKIESNLAGSVTYVVESMAEKLEYKRDPPDDADLRIAGHALDRWLQGESVALATADQGLGAAYVQAVAALREKGGSNIRRLMQDIPLMAYAGRFDKDGLVYDIVDATKAPLEKEVDKECELQIRFIERKL
ncbi:hypothetical protein KY329_03200 [Candidatus Woesearchaeota archaeon]|nr:hypothetical protein [Candidatus Woesearchaeota archaeon]